MADIRINALATTASSTASDDYIAIDGSANGTRKLSAYSPTFGGNLTVSGTATLGPTNPFKFDTNLMQSTASGFNGALVRSAVSTVGNPTFSNVDDTDTGIYFPAANTLAITTGGTQRLSVDATATTLSGNLNVAGVGTFNKSLDNITTESDYAIRIKTSADDGGLYLGANSTISAIQAIDPNTTFARNLAIQSQGGNVLIGTTTDGGQKLQVNGTAAISGALSIGNTVQTAVSVASTHKVTISIGGSTYYLLATNV